MPSLEALIGSRARGRRGRVAAGSAEGARPAAPGHADEGGRRAHGIPVLQPAKIRDEAFLQAIRDLQPDLGVVVAFGRILPDALLAIPRLGMINVHASILPRYRGAAPIQRAVLAGDAETGVTIMRVDHRDGRRADVRRRRRCRSRPTRRAARWQRTLAQLGARAPAARRRRPRGGTRRRDAAGRRRARRTPRRSRKAKGAIDWTEPADVVHNKVRGLQPWPLASTHLAGDRLVLRRTAASGSGLRRVRRGQVRACRHAGSLTPASAQRRPDPGDAPGTIVRAEGDELIVACGGGTALRVLEIQPEGRRTMTAREFLAGRGVAEGARFEP